MTGKLRFIYKEWLEEMKCLKADGTIDFEKLDMITKGQKYLIDETSFLVPERKPLEVEINQLKRNRKKSR